MCFAQRTSLMTRALKRELFNVPQMRVHFAFPFKVSEWAILRKVKERPE